MKKISFSISKIRLLLSLAITLTFGLLFFLIFREKITQTPFIILRYEHLILKNYEILAIASILVSFVVFYTQTFANSLRMKKDTNDVLKRFVGYFVASALLICALFFIVINMYHTYLYNMMP